MTPRLEVRLIRDGHELAALAPEWDRLWERSPRATPFQSPIWLLAWWRAFRPGELMVAAVRSQAKLVGMAPFYRETLGERARLLPIGISISDYMDILIDEALGEAVLGAIARAYASRSLDWDEWELPELPPGSAALEMRCPESWAQCDAPASPCPVLILPGSSLDFEAQLPERKRRKLRLMTNRLIRHGNTAAVALEEQPADWWLAQLWRLHAACWSGRGGTGVLADDRLRGFHSEVLEGFVCRGLARMFALRIGADTAGIYYGFVHRRRAYGYLTGFNPAYGYYSPGSFVVRHAIEQAIADGVEEFHFLRGGEAYKYDWGARDRWNRRRIFRRQEADAGAVPS
jgi:CelD/BcsL family acetyltransferase involved in cellulose biosynthesis